MSLLKEGVRRNIKIGGTAVLASAAVLLASNGSVPVEIKLPPCNVDPRPKTVKVNIINSPVFLGSITLTRDNNNPEEFNIDSRLKKPPTVRIPFILIEYGAPFIDSGTGRSVEITTKKDRGIPSVSISSTCDE